MSLKKFKKVNNMTKVVFAKLQARIYVWLGGLDLSAIPKEERKKVFEAECKKILKEYYPKLSSKEMKQEIAHLTEYWTIVFQREL